MTEPQEYDVDLDLLTRAQLAELPPPVYDVSRVLDEWAWRVHTVTSSHHHAGLFLELLAAEGYRVTAIEVPDIHLPTPTE